MRLCTETLLYRMCIIFRLQFARVMLADTERVSLENLEMEMWNEK